MWEQIRSNQVRSGFVIAGMGVLLVGTGVAVGGLFGGEFSSGSALVGGLIALVIWFAMWVFASTAGEKVLLGIAGAQQIEKRDHPQLVNVVEEMTIAASLGKRPRVFIIDDPSPNAFAAGRGPDDACVAVTTGLLGRLDRDELQGVIAHEMGHVKNRDVALMTTAGVMMGAIIFLSEITLRVLWYGGGRRRSRSSDGGGHIALVIVAIVFMILAPILAQLLYFALSRRREYLADASSARFTRYPEGLASALEKISGLVPPLHDESRVTAPMYIVPPSRARAAAGLGATHPPAQERIRILRSMGGQAGFKAYEKAYRRMKKQNLIGPRTLGIADEVAAAVPTHDAPAAPASPAHRTRQASDALFSAAGYARVACTGCGATLKIPPQLVARLSRCPRCHEALSAG